MASSRLGHVLEALAEQDAVHYAAVTTRAGDVVAEAGDVPRPGEDDPPQATVSGADGTATAPVRTMLEVGMGRILHVGTIQRLPGEEVRELRSVVASSM